MNIFFLDKSSKKSAELMADQHVVKMVLESAQLLSTCHRVLDGIKITTSRFILNDEREDVLYKSTHVNHPCSVWLRESSENYYWLYEHFTHLSNEYTKRYGKIHKSFSTLNDYLKRLPKNIKLGDFTKPALAMPDEYMKEDYVEAYRDYYLKEKILTGKVSYNKADIPDIFKEV